MAISKAESRLKSNAVGKNKNGSIDVGLFQINSGVDESTFEKHKAKYVNPNENISEAIFRYNKYGWCQWAVYKSSGSWNGPCTTSEDESWQRFYKGNENICDKYVK